MRCTVLPRFRPLPHPPFRGAQLGPLRRHHHLRSPLQATRIVRHGRMSIARRKATAWRDIVPTRRMRREGVRRPRFLPPPHPHGGTAASRRFLAGRTRCTQLASRSSVAGPRVSTRRISVTTSSP